MIHVGDALTVLRTLPAGTVQTCITSPPYWGLRDYGTATWEGGATDCDHLGEPFRTSANINANWDGGRDVKNATKRQPFGALCGKCGVRRIDAQLGLEPTPDAYVAALVAVFREVRRVLRDDGTLWLNLGDSYCAQPAGNKVASGFSQTRPSRRTGNGDQETVALPTKDFASLKPKDLVGIPWRVAFALQAGGWYLRSDIIWAKPNPMPESVTDRPTKAHEYLFLLAKSATYFYDAEAIKEPVTGNAHARGNGVNPKATAPGQGIKQNTSFSAAVHGLVNERNKRSVWTVATQPYPEAHFATFPPDLIKPCVLAGTSERGGCSVCGAPWERVVERMPVSASDGETTGRYSSDPAILSASSRGIGKSRQHYRSLGLEGPPAPTTLGWRPTCAHDAPTVPQTVLDPFAGAGTTCYVAKELGRQFVGIELNPAYIALAEDRMRQEVLPF